MEFSDARGGAERRGTPRVRKAMDPKFTIAVLPGEKELVAALDKLLVAQSHDMSETGVCM